MKREELTALGLTAEQIDSVMASHKKEVNSYRSHAEELTTERDGLKEQLTSRDADITKLKVDLGNNDELKTKLSELETKYTDETSKLQSELSKTKLNSVISDELSKTNARDPKVIKALLDLDAIQLAEDGKLKGLSEQLASLQESQAYLFEGEQKPNYKPGNGEPQSFNSDLSKAMKQPNFNFTEWAQQNNKE